MSKPIKHIPAVFRVLQPVPSSHPAVVTQTRVDDHPQLRAIMCDKSTQISIPVPECPVCMNAFEWNDANLQPAVLPCGHSFCRACLKHLQERKCPTCRAELRHRTQSLPSNFSLRETIAPLSERPECEEQLPGVAHHQSDSSASPLSAAPQISERVPRASAAGAAVQTSPPLTSHQQPSRQECPGGPSTPRATAAVSQQHLPPPPDTVWILRTQPPGPSSASLCYHVRSLQALLDASPDPAYIDLQGKIFYCPSESGLRISKNDVTLFNGTFVATDVSPGGEGCLNVYSTGAVLKNIEVRFVTKGVAVHAGAQLSMTDVKMYGKGIGMTVANTGGGAAAGMVSLRSCRVSVRECMIGIVLEDCAAVLTDIQCSAKLQGLKLSGSSSRVFAQCMSFASCNLGLVVAEGASAQMVGCTWTGSLLSGINVQGPGSKVELTRCKVDIPPILRGGGEVITQEK